MINYIVVGQNRPVTLAVLQAVRSFTDAGCMVIGTQGNRGLRWSSLCEQQATIRFDGADDEVFVDLVNDLTRFTRHLVLIPADCHAIRMVNRVAGQLAVTISPIPDTPTLTMLDDRWRFQRLCRQHGLPVPASRLIGGESEPDFPALAAELGLPFMVTPISHEPDLESVMISCRRDLWRLPARGLLVAQAIAPGADVSISLIADRGQLCAFVIAGLGLDQDNAGHFHHGLERIAARLCEVSAFNGAMHLGARVDTTTGNLTLVDCVPHFWPDLTSTILAGLNLVAECVHPSPRHSRLQVVTQVGAALGHPLAPARWHRLRAPDEGGRLLRAMSFDLYSLSMSTGGALREAWRNMAQRPVASLPQIGPRMGPRIGPGSAPRRDAAAQ